ncbi:hypothetical protein TSL6_15830 [Sulfurovum sp. TSL6]|uniref:hypothetical protein n=1 Tax=Sulfurovum sp. TSL6 TaxID=2826995 RepID=UPI001CC3EBE2|nr:hypothetical protein [Sulfurovum sp. TSL6]GIU01077.1 hypothetical protein TSL6_15830 [Sulfurovum sp. TSL6]
MGRKKLGFGLLVLIIVTVLYYFNHTENVQNLNTLQKALNLQLTDIQTNGFTVSDRQIKKDTEHFVIQINDPQKAALFLAQKGIRLTVEETKELKGIQIGTDVTYLKDMIALEVYPLTLPTYLSTAFTTENDKKVLAQLKDMIKKKIFLMHVDIVHSTTTFKGYVKDINERIEGEKEVKLILQGLHFSGDIKKEKIVKYMQRFETLHLYMSDALNRTISGYQSHYELTGTTAYDYMTDYSIKKIEIDEEAEGTLLADTMVLHSTSTVKDGLATETLKAKIKNLELLFEKEKFAMHTLHMDMNISNIDVDTSEKLQKTDPNKEKELGAQLEALASNKMHLAIPMLSVKKVTLHGKEMYGFTLKATLQLDESLDIYRLGMKPKHVLQQIDGDLHLSFSNEMLTMLKEDPEFMIGYMMYRPKRSEGQRIYHINIMDGSVKINGKLLEF